MGWSRVVESDGYAEENNARMGSGEQMSDPACSERFLMVIGSPNSTFASREFFYFQILEWVVSPSGTVPGEITGLSGQNGLIGCFL